MPGLSRTVWGAVFGLMLICGVGAHVHAEDACLTEVLSNGMEVGSDLTKLKLDYQLTAEIDIKDFPGKHGSAKLLEDLEYSLPPGIKPSGVYKLKDPLLVQAQDGQKYLLRKDTSVKYELPQGLTYRIIIPKDTLIKTTSTKTTSTKDASTKDTPPKDTYSFTNGTNVIIIPPENYQSLLTINAKTIVDRIPGSSSMGTTLQVDPERAPVNGFITLTLAKTNFDFANAQFQVCLRSQGTKDKDIKPFVASKDVELKEVHTGKAVLRARIPQIDAGPVDLLVVARGPGYTLAEAVSQEFAVSSRCRALYSWLAALVVPWIIAAIVTARKEPKKWFRFDPIWFVSGKYGGASLSLAQILLWTILVFSASFYVLVASGKLLDLSNDVLMLLGIAGATSVLAKITASVKDEKGQVLTEAYTNTKDPKWIDLFRTAGSPDLYKFQMGLFTILAAFFVIGKIYTTLEFPVLPAGLLTLIGISNGVYLAAKTTSQSVFDKLLEKYRELEEAKQEAQKLNEKATEASNRSIDAENKKNKLSKERSSAATEQKELADSPERTSLTEKLKQLDAKLQEAETARKQAEESKKQTDDAVKVALERVEKLEKEFKSLKDEATKQT